jgi:hypothetical protein
MAFCLFYADTQHDGAEQAEQWRKAGDFDSYRGLIELLE